MTSKAHISRQQSLVADIQVISASYRNFAFSKHFHTDFHFGLVHHGEQKVTSLGEGFVTGPGQVQVMLPGQVHDGQTLAHQGFETQILSIRPQYFEHFLQHNTRHSSLVFNSQLIEQKEVFATLAVLQTALISKHPFKLAIESECLTAFSKIVSRYANWQLPKVHKLGTQASKNVIDYMHENIGQKITLQALAALCGLNEFTFLRQFKRHFGLTPAAWLAQLRLEYAIKLLGQGIDGTDVAHQLGFYDQAHFIHAFKRCYGITPKNLYA